MDLEQNVSFASVGGVIVDIVPAAVGVGALEGCILRVMVEDDDGNNVNFMVTPETFVVDWAPLPMGKKCVFWYRADAPAPLIYPPQYTAVVAAAMRNDRMVDVSFYDAALVNEQKMLQLNLDRSVKLRTANNQIFLGNPANHDLVVLYDNSTRSIPAQTTPKTVFVLCRPEDFR